jgi:amino acid permease
MVPDANHNFGEIVWFNFSFWGIARTVPMILNAYFFQSNISMMYDELDNKNEKKMSNMIVSGISLAVYVYILIGAVGYVTFLNGNAN